MEDVIMVDGIDIISSCVDPDDASKEYLKLNLYKPVAEALGFDGFQAGTSNSYWSTFDYNCFFCEIYQVLQPIKRKPVERMATYLEWVKTPTKLEYEYGDKLDVDGGKYKVYFNDGSSKTVDVKASAVSGFNSYQPGTHILSVKHNEDVVSGNSLIYKVKIGPSNGKLPLRGDVDGSGVVDSNDAVYTLMGTLFPSAYPANQDEDYDGNKVTDSNDAVYLLMYTLFETQYPLKNAGYDTEK